MDTYNDIKKIIEKMIIEITQSNTENLLDEDVDPDINLYESYIIDSLDFVELIIRIEERFKVDLLDEQADITDLSTINDLTQAVIRKGSLYN